MFVQTIELGSFASEVTAFDPTATANCGGTPKICTPLFHASLARGDPNLQPTVASGRVFVSTGTDISVFDAAGLDRCTAGSCAPLFRLNAASAGEVSVANGQAFTTAGTRLLAFDATGRTGCGGSPIVCQPLWRGVLSATTNRDSPIIAGDRVFANSIGSPGVGAIEAFDRSSGSGCSGSPLTCPRLFKTQTATTFDRSRASASANLLVVASGTLPIPPPFSVPLRFKLTFFDLTGTTGCSESPRTCQPVASLDLDTDATGVEQVGRPALASGLIVVPHLFSPPLVVGLP